ncbi:transcriptional regulator [Sphingobium abikonense]|uniref:transcriptional regulator n=1 Tax=Sphingobium abikonense TaxID=86193 RepID=UPI003517F62D
MVGTVTPFEALQLAVTHLGSQGKLARLCSVSSTAVWKWLQSGKRLPAEHVLAVEAATGVSRHMLRPDIYPVSLRFPSAEPGEECGDILTTASPAVACDRRNEAQRKETF